MPEDITDGPVVEGEPSVEASDRPEWLPEKFDNPEALAKSYTELERKLTEAGQDRSNLEAQLNNLYDHVQSLEERTRQASQPQPAAYDPNSDPYVTAFERAMEEGDYRAGLAISVGLAQMAAKRDIEAVAQNTKGSDRDWDAYGYIAEQTAVAQIGPEEFNKYRDRIAEASKYENFEGLTPQQGGLKLVDLYKQVAFDDLRENQQTLAQRQAEAERLAKIQAQTTTGSNSPIAPPTRDDAAVDRIVNAAREGSYQSLISGS